MQRPKALVGAKIFDGKQLYEDACLIVMSGVAVEIRPLAEASDCNLIQVGGGILMPGFVDLQVNGGGGVMFNDDPSVRTLTRIAKAHKTCGTAAFLPTLITDSKAKTKAAITATIQAVQQNVEGIMGLHLEGPHLDPLRKGAHDARLIRPMDDDDLAQLIEASDKLPNLMMTVAPESVTNAQITALANAGVIVSLGHTDCTYDRAMQAFEAGAKMVTHVFNAMSQLGGRTPGLVGAALSSGVHVGLIADGLHVHPAAMKTALAANPEGVFLVTDAMAVAGSDISSFELGGRKIRRYDGKLTLQDGTLAGADLTLARAIQIVIKEVGLPLERALAMATDTPATILRNRGSAGTFVGTLKDMILLDLDTASTRSMNDFDMK